VGKFIAKVNIWAAAERPKTDGLLIGARLINFAALR
jgi:hypothetical protein